MQTLYLWLETYGQKNSQFKYLEAYIFLFPEALSLWNQVTNKNTDNSAI